MSSGSNIEAYSNGYNIIPSDDDFLSYDCFSIYIGSGGDIKILTEKGDIVFFKNVPNGKILPIHALKIFSTDTTATDIVGFITVKNNELLNADLNLDFSKKVYKHKLKDLTEEETFQYQPLRLNNNNYPDSVIDSDGYWKWQPHNFLWKSENPDTQPRTVSCIKQEVYTLISIGGDSSYTIQDGATVLIANANTPVEITITLGTNNIVVTAGTGVTRFCLYRNDFGGMVDNYKLDDPDFPKYIKNEQSSDCKVLPRYSYFPNDQTRQGLLLDYDSSQEVFYQTRAFFEVFNGEEQSTSGSETIIPTGETTPAGCTETQTYNTHGITSTTSYELDANTNYCASFYVKPSLRNYFSFILWSGVIQINVGVDLIDKTIKSKWIRNANILLYDFQSLKNNWIKFSIVFKILKTEQPKLYIRFNTTFTNLGNEFYTGDPSQEAMFCWGYTIAKTRFSKIAPYFLVRDRVNILNQQNQQIVNNESDFVKLKTNYITFVPCAKGMSFGLKGVVKLSKKINFYHIHRMYLFSRRTYTDEDDLTDITINDVHVVGFYATDTGYDLIYFIDTIQGANKTYSETEYKHDDLNEIKITTQYSNIFTPKKAEIEVTSGIREGTTNAISCTDAQENDVISWNTTKDVSTHMFIEKFIMYNKVFNHPVLFDDFFNRL